MGLSEGRGLPEVLQGLGAVDPDPVALLVDAAQGVQGLGLALVGTAFKPGDREVFVRLDAMPMQEAFSLEPELVAFVSASLRAKSAQL